MWAMRRKQCKMKLDGSWVMCVEKITGYHVEDQSGRNRKTEISEQATAVFRQEVI